MSNNRLMKYTKILVVLAIVMALVRAVIYINDHSREIKVEYVDRPIIRMTDTLTPKINELKDELIQDLKRCEGGSHTEDDGLLVLDTNGKFSVGLFQFQKSTVQHYYKTLYGREISGKEAILIALDNKLLTELASDIIFKQGKLNDWVNCDRKKGLSTQLDIIKRLSK